MNNETQQEHESEPVQEIPEEKEKDIKEDEDEDGVQECPICYEKIQKYGFCTTNCKHTFCMNCMVESMKKRKTCPLCRENMDPNPTSIDETGDNLFAYNQGQEEGYVYGYIDGEIRGFEQYRAEYEELYRKNNIISAKYKRVKDEYKLTMKQYNHSFKMSSIYNTESI